ncbi:hypothetical protein IHQ71_07770 [Rhizobium sp. TH2]|uniref:hypothetical protein n=1 Tax=Rhizobium sp. TH2 TaxID=2775403 RepID=UPI0021585CB0|nr:hypothetical protein [Rhizobium sp. TH2]UVC10485.1 hypothetical protein IHQ71_07770 [Rhizobium sp. TH2]
MPGEAINNPGSNPNSDHRRTGGSANDPHGGHEHTSERRGPDPDPIDELVPAGDGSLPATKLSVSEETETLAFTETQKPNLLDEMAAVDGTGTLDPRAQPGFGPTELDGPQFEGNPEIGIDPNDVRNEMPPREN